MREVALGSLVRSFSTFGSAIVRPAHISGIGLGLCLVLALTTPPSGVQRANASRPAFSTQIVGPVTVEHSRGWSKFGPTGNLGALDVTRIVQALGNSQRLVGYFEEMGYRLDALREGGGTVPRLYLANLPTDLPKVESAEIRKAVFIKALLPIILRTNEEVLDRRARLETLSRKVTAGRALSEEEQAWLDETAALYDLKKPNLAELLRRVDVVPPSLALAQAALESGWGTSRFAQKGNALFGQKIFAESSAAMPSYDKQGNEVFRMRSFEDVIGSVRSYVHNLNSHPAYADFRKVRADMRRKAGPDRHDFGPLAGDALAKSLLSYSERGEDYVTDVRTLMQTNDLRVFDRARLANEQLAGNLRPGA